ncbi:MAG: 5-formyltetrahydrofolate cyclo-ligase [Mycobacteriales bacterium]
MDGSAIADVAAAKRALRSLVLARRAMLAPGSLDRAGPATAALVLALPQVRAARVVAAYVGVGLEVPTSALLDGLTARGTVVLLPVLEADDSLSWRRIDDSSALVRGRHGLLEPPVAAARGELTDAEVVVVPGVCYDKSGARLGRGGGSYDRALRQLASAVTIVGTALEADVVEEVPVEPHDVPVHIIVTPDRVITIEAGGR